MRGASRLHGPLGLMMRRRFGNPLRIAVITPLSRRSSGLPESAPGPAQSPPSPPSSESVVMPYLHLSKFRLSSLVLATTMFGYGLAPGAFALVPFVGSAVGTALCIGSANTWNQIIEVERDRRMLRTENRPLPQGRLSMTQAWLFGAVTAAVGTGIMCVTSPPITAVLASGNIFLYALIYTPLKPRTPLNTYVGAVVGAIPPMIGWAAQTGSLDGGAWALGALLYLWQMPHFHSLAFNLRDDYIRGGYKMLAVTHPERLGTNALWHSVAILPLGAVFAYTGVTDSWFALTSLMPSGWLVFKAWQFQRDPVSARARTLFFATLRFLPAYLGLMLVHHLVL